MDMKIGYVTGGWEEEWEVRYVEGEVKNGCTSEHGELVSLHIFIISSLHAYMFVTSVLVVYLTKLGRSFLHLTSTFHSIL